MRLSGETGMMPTALSLRSTMAGRFSAETQFRKRLLSDIEELTDIALVPRGHLGR